MADVFLTISPAPAVNLTVSPAPAVNISFNGFDILAYMQSSIKYDSDKDASDAGKSIYVTSAQHESLPYGVLKLVEP